MRNDACVEESTVCSLTPVPVLTYIGFWTQYSPCRLTAACKREAHAQDTDKGSAIRI